MEPTANRIEPSVGAAQEALGHLATIAASTAAQSEHEARMVAATASSGEAARKLLEQQACRARRLAWVIGLTASAAALIAIAAAAYLAWTARDTTHSYQIRLLEQRAEQRSLEGERDVQLALVGSLREQRMRDDRLVDRLLTAAEQSRSVGASAIAATTATDRNIDESPERVDRPRVSRDDMASATSPQPIVRLLERRSTGAVYDSPLWIYPNRSGRCTPTPPRHLTLTSSATTAH